MNRNLSDDTASARVPAALTPIDLDTMVPCTPRAAFDYFTRDIGRWWPLSRYSCSEARAAGVAFEGGVGGRVIETDVDGNQYVWGTVRTWEPGKALVFTWHPGKSDDAALEVSITFAQAGTMTRVRLVQRGWERLGDAAAKSREAYAGGWPTVLGRLYKGYCDEAAAREAQS